MKVLRIVPYLDFGGVEQVLANSIPNLTQIEEMEVLVIVLGSGGRVEETLTRLGVQVKVLNQNPKIPNLRLLATLRGMIAKIKPDVVHCQSAEANFHGLIAARWAGVPVRIGEEIGFPNHHSYWKFIFRLVYINATKIIAISEAVRDRIMELGEVEKEKVELVYNPVELRKKDELDFDKNPNFKEILRYTFAKKVGRQHDVDFEGGDGEMPFVFVTTCRLVLVKNLDRLINVFAQFCKESSGKFTELWIVGDGPLRAELENHSKAMGISEKVRFWGFQEDVFPFLEMSDVFVLPSLSEGSSVSLVEAMSVGLPSIVTKIGGTIEILGESNSGILIDPFDQDSIFQALSKSIHLSYDQRKEMGIKAKQQANRFTVKNYLNTLLTIYNYQATLEN